MNSGNARRLALATSIAGLLTLVGDRAGAVPPAAEALFRDGRRLMAEGKISEACAQFAASYALEPASGTLLNLALCHEKEGKTATAWGEYRAAASLASEQDRKDRTAAAEARIAALEQKLARVTVIAPKDVPDLKVTDDDGGPATLSLGTAVPIDPGVHHLRVSAPGYRVWLTTVEIAAGEQRTVEIANIEREPAPSPPPIAAPSPGAPPVLVASNGATTSAPSFWQRPTDFYVAAGGGFLLLSGTVLWGVGYAEFQSAKSACNGGAGCADYDHRVSVIHTLQGVAIGAWVAGGVAVLASGLHYKFWKAPPKLQVALDPTHRQFGIGYAF